MGKRIRAQRIGRGSPTFKASIQRRYKVSFPTNMIVSNRLVEGVVKAIEHDPGRGAPIAEVEYDGGQRFAVVAVQGMRVGQRVMMGPGAPVKEGNIVMLGNVPGGTNVCMVELKPGDGGKLVRSSGTFATVMAHVGDKTVLRLPSKKLVEVSSKALALVGSVAGAGRDEKPFLKAGKKYHHMRAKHRPYPRVRGVVMVPPYHPFGGGSHKLTGRPETVKRTAPPGRKVGLIAARRTGRKKK